jgi:hypothetical protein
MCEGRSRDVEKDHSKLMKIDPTRSRTASLVEIEGQILPGRQYEEGPVGIACVNDRGRGMRVLTIDESSMKSLTVNEGWE